MTLQSISKENAIFNAAFLWIRVTSKITLAWPSKAIFLPASATDFLNFLRFLYFYLYCIESVWCSHRRTIWSCTFYSQDNMLKINKAARMTEDKKTEQHEGALFHVNISRAYPSVQKDVRLSSLSSGKYGKKKIRNCNWEQIASKYINKTTCLPIIIS